MTSSVYAEHPPRINLVISTRLAVYNSKSSKPNKSASPFRRKDLATFKSYCPANSMAQFSTCCSLYQNPHNGKDKLAGGTPTEGSNRCTPAPSATHAPTSSIVPVVASLIVSGSADSSVVRYLENDLQRILRTGLDFRSFVLAPALVVAPALHYEDPRKWPLKARFPDIYQSKTHLECYNFF